MHIPELFQNEMHKILLDFDTQADHLILTRPNINYQEKKNFSYRFCYSSGLQIKNKRKRKAWQILLPCQRADKVEEHVGDGNTNSR